MHFKDTTSEATWRRQVRQFLADELPDELRGAGGLHVVAKGGAWDQWRHALMSRGWVAPAWPREYGGAGMTVLDQFILTQEFAEAGAPQLGGLGVVMLGPALIVMGSDEQKQEHLPRILTGDAIWCQGYSEPGSGSDLASVQTRAVRDGDDWIISGQKIWTSGAHHSDWIFMLARSDPNAPKHRGVTYFLVDMKSPGITVRPLVNMAGGHEFNEVFFEDVRVPHGNVVGEVNRGWYVGITAQDFGRAYVGSTVVGMRQSVEQNISWFRENRGRFTPEVQFALRSKWAERCVEVGVGNLLVYRVISLQAAGQMPNYQASMSKLFSSELSQRVSRTAMEMMGLGGQLMGNDAPFSGRVSAGYLQSVSSTIAGGTSEIQRNIVAARGLGLPRT